MWSLCERGEHLIATSTTAAVSAGSLYKSYLLEAYTLFPSCSKKKHMWRGTFAILLARGQMETSTYVWGCLFPAHPKRLSTV